MWNIHRDFKWFGIALSLFVFLAQSAVASLNLVGKWVAGPCEVMDTDGSHAFFNAGTHLLIADISNPATPEIRGEFQFPVSLTDVKISGGYAYALLGGLGLKVLDVSNPSSPVEVGELAATNSADQILLHGDTAYLIDGGLRILDVSDPTSPVQIGFHEAWGNRATISDNQLFLVGGQIGLRIFDISNPAVLQPIGNFQPAANIDFEDIVVKGNQAFVCANGNHLFGIDVSDPSEPAYFIGDHRNVYNWAKRLGLVEGNLWVVGWTGLTVFDLQDPNTMPLSREYSAPLQEGKAFAANGEFGLIAEHQNGLVAFETILDGSPVRVGEFDTRGIPKDVSIFNTYACLAMGNRGLKIVDYSNPGNLVEVASLDSMQADAVLVSGQYAYVLGGNLSIVDISSPENPSILGQIPFPSAEYLSVEDGFAYMSGGSYPLMIADVSDPTNPIEKFSAPWTYKVSHRGMAVVGGYTFVASIPWSWYPQITITNATNPSDPTYVGGIERTQAYDIAARGNDLFLVDFGLRVLDVSVPENPVVLGELPVDGLNGDLAIEGNTAYIVSGGIMAIDISDYSMMYIRDEYDSGLGAVAVAAAGNVVLLADNDEGLIVLRDTNSNPQEVVVDIKPGNDQNSLNCRNQRGAIPVAILSDMDFDALSVDHSTVRFGPGEAGETHENPHGHIRHEEDVDRDGDLDLVFHFRLADTRIQCGDTTVILTGETFDGQAVIGSDLILTRTGGGKGQTAGMDIRIRPNPFNPKTKVSFYADQPQRVRVSVYDIRGRRVVELTNEQYQVGEHSIDWQGRDSSGRAVPSGEYFFRVEIGNQVETRKAMLLR